MKERVEAATTNSKKNAKARTHPIQQPPRHDVPHSHRLTPIPPQSPPLHQRPRRADPKMRPRLFFALSARIPLLPLPPSHLRPNSHPPTPAHTYARTSAFGQRPAPLAANATSSGGPTICTSCFGAPACAYPFVGACRYIALGVTVPLRGVCAAGQAQARRTGYRWAGGQGIAEGKEGKHGRRDVGYGGEARQRRTRRASSTESKAGWDRAQTSPAIGRHKRRASAALPRARRCRRR